MKTLLFFPLLALAVSAQSFVSVSPHLQLPSTTASADDPCGLLPERAVAIKDTNGDFLVCRLGTLVKVNAAIGPHQHDASDVVSGIFGPARLGSGTPSASTVLFGNGAWGAAPGGGAPVCTNTEAIDGQNNTCQMTPLRSFEAMEIWFPIPPINSNTAGKVLGNPDGSTHEWVDQQTLPVREYFTTLPQNISNLSLSAVAISGSANVLRCHRYETASPLKLNTIAFAIATADSQGTMVAGLYDVAGNKLAQTAQHSTASTGSVAVSLQGTVDIPAGASFYHCMSSDSTTAALQGILLTSGIWPGIQNLGPSKNTFNATNLTAGGVMPATLGAPNAFGLSTHLLYYFFQ